MIRGIKYRGQRLTNREWVYGHLFVWSNGRCDIKKEDSRGFMTVYSVDSATVGQYTGLKDKNGNEIYEGDIIQEIGVHVCRYYPGYFEFVDVNGYISPVSIAKDAEVIGNIHDNPELLKSE